MARVEEISEEQMRKWRSMGVKTIEVGPESPSPGTRPSFKIEFFPRTLLDVAGIEGDATEAPTEPPPAPDTEAQMSVPPAMARVLGRKSVS